MQKTLPEQNGLWQALKETAQSIITWEWTKKLLHWLIISAGTVSECAFLVASIWMSINASVHPLVLLLMDEQTSEHLSELATAAYVALPELILGLAFVVTIGHVRLWLYNRENYSAAIWMVLYGLPTLVFLVLSLVTLGCSVSSVNFRMPELLVVVRALAGYMFAFTSLLYAQLGVPQEKDRLQQKDTMLAELRQQNEVSLSTLSTEYENALAMVRREKDGIIANLHRTNEMNLATLRNEKDAQIIERQKQIHLLTEELTKANATIESEQKQKEFLANEVNVANESALQAYSEECKTWLASGAKTVSIDAIVQFTGHAKRAITHAIKTGKLQTHSRNKDLVLVSSLSEWLKTVQPSGGKAEEIPMLHLVNG